MQATLFPILPLIIILLFWIISIFLHKKSGKMITFRHLIPAYILLIAAMLVFYFRYRYREFIPFTTTLIFILLLAVCAGAGAYLYNKLTYFFGVIAAALIFIFYSIGTGISLYFIWVPISAVLLLLLCLFGLLSEQKDLSPDPSPSKPPKAPEHPPTPSFSERSDPPAILCISGKFTGALFSFREEEQIAFGKDPSQCQIVLDGASILDCHCSLWFDPKVSLWYVVSHAADGTYHSGTTKLKKHLTYSLPSGTILSIGNGPDMQQFQLL